MDLQLHGKHALITGGSKGIGLACARGFLQEGARVTLVSRGQEHLAAARRTPDCPIVHRRLLGALTAASETGDLATLECLFQMFRQPCPGAGRRHSP